jgi:hypothetical protein
MFDFAEMRGCTLSEVMGLSKHKESISNNELKWWFARTSMKPLPAARKDLEHAEDLLFASGKMEIRSETALRDWYKEPVTEVEKWADAKDEVKKLQAELNEKRKNG